MNRLTGVALLIAILRWSDALDAGDGPTDKNPDLPLAVWGDSDVEKLRDSGYQALAQATKLLSATDTASRPLVVMDELTKALVAAQHADRSVRWLTEFNELAGVDLSMRLAPVQKELRRRILSARAHPEIAKYLSKSARTFVSEWKKKEKIIGDADRLASMGKWDEAEEALVPVFFELNAQCAWFEGLGAELLRPYEVPMQTIHTKLSLMRKEKRNNALHQAQQRPRFPEIMNAFQGTLNDLRKQGAAQINGRKLTGPEILETLVARWGPAQNQAVRSMGLTGFLQGRGDSELAEELQLFRQDLATFAVDLIKSDAVRVKGDEVAPLYQAYVSAATRLCLILGDTDVENQFTQALDQLAKKSPALRKDVAGYQAATDGVLAWRRRIADVNAEKFQNRYSDLEKTFAKKFQLEGAFQGFFPKEQVWMVLADPVVAVMERADKLMIGQGVSVPRIMNAKGDTSYSSGRFNGSCYAVFPPIDTPHAVVDVLRGDLLLSGKSPPLSLRGAVALASAEQGMFEEAGGDVIRAELEGMLSRFSRSAEDDPAFGPGSRLFFVESFKQVLMRLDVSPRWARTRYAVFEIEKAPAQNSQ